jgi:hypothetical protein
MKDAATVGSMCVKHEWAQQYQCRLSSLISLSNTDTSFKAWDMHTMRDVVRATFGWKRQCALAQPHKAMLTMSRAVHTPSSSNRTTESVACRLASLSRIC